MEDVAMSAADLSASVPTDATPAPESVTETQSEPAAVEPIEEPAAPDDNQLDELNAEGAEEPEEPVDETVPPETEEQPVEAQTEQAEELPEGVSHGKDTKGRERFFLTEGRYRTFENAHKTVQQLSESIGEPLTPDAFKLRNDAYMAQERMYQDLLSGDATAQTNVLKFWFDEAKRAMDAQEIGSDPTVPLAQAFYESVKGNPQAYANLRTRAAHDFIDEMYQEAASKGDKNLWYAAQRFDSTIGRKYRAEADMATFGKPDEAAQLRAQIQQLTNQLQGKQTNTRAEQFETWQAKAKQESDAAVLNEAILPALSEAQTLGVWAKRPEAFKRYVTDPLNSAVTEAIAKDGAFNERIAMLERQAKMAPSEQRRAEIAAQRKQMTVNRANLAVEALKGKILRDAAALAKESSDATHQRRAAAQTHRTPGGGGTPVNRGIAPKMDFEDGTPANLLKSLQSLGI